MKLAAVEDQQRQVGVEMGQQSFPLPPGIEPQDGVVVWVLLEVGVESICDDVDQYGLPHYEADCLPPPSVIYLCTMWMIAAEGSG